MIAAGLTLALLMSVGSLSSNAASLSTNTLQGKSSVSQSMAIKAGGKFVFCSEIDFPPLESYQGNTPVGADIDIGKALARRMGKTAEFQNTGFDALVASLLANKCDAILSGMNDTAQRREQIDFVDYIKIGQSLIVPKGNPKHITGLASLSGKAVATVVGTTQADTLKQENVKLKAAGNTQISIVLFPQNTAALSAVLTGKVDVDFDSATFAAIAVKKNPTLVVAGRPVNPVPDGIGISKNNKALEVAVQRDINKMYADGTMKRILGKWGLEAIALKSLK